MYCGNCGVENSNTAKFCKECGSPLPQAKIVAPIKVQTSVSEEASIKLAEPNVEMTRAKKESVKIPWKIIGAIVGAIALIAIVYFVIQSNKVINLNDYMRIEYAGYDKYGKANAYVDWNGLKEKYGDTPILVKEWRAAVVG